MLLIVILATSLLAGCNRGNENAGSTASGGNAETSVVEETAETPEPVIEVEEEPIRISYFNSYAVGTNSPQDAYVIQRLQEHFNIYIDYEMFSGNDYNTALNLKIAAGETPDCFHLSYATLITLAEQGVLAEVPRETLYTHSPNMMAYADRYDPDAWVFTNWNNKNWAIPTVWSIGGTSRVNVIREDWCDNMGLSIPTNIYEFETMMETFLHGDPNKDGSTTTHTIGTYVTATSTEHFFPGLSGMFGVHPTLYLLDGNGKIQYGSIDPRAKDYLAKMNEWYELGYIDPEFYVDTGDTWTEKWVSGKLGYIASSWWWTSGPAEKYFSGLWYDPVISANPSAKVTTFTPMRGPDGEYGVSQMPMLGVIGIIGFGKHLEKDMKVMERWLQVWDYIHSDVWWHVFVYDGIEGETFTRNPDNSITYLENFDTFDKRAAYGANGALVPAIPNYEIYDAATKDGDYIRRQQALAIGPINALKNFPMESSIQYGEILRDIAREAYIGFIIGTRPLTEWDNFVAHWLNEGGQIVIDEAQVIYDTHFKR